MLFSGVALLFSTPPPPYTTLNRQNRLLPPRKQLSHFSFCTTINEVTAVSISDFMSHISNLEVSNSLSRLLTSWLFYTCIAQHEINIELPPNLYVPQVILFLNPPVLNTGSKTGKKKERNLSTCWKNIKEKEALERYKNITGNANSVFFPDFHVSRNLNSDGDRNRNWLAASPDGVIDKMVYGLPCRGVLEIKCPFYKGNMRKGFPWTQVPYNYIPQAQGLMEILDRDWMDFYVWTPKGSSLIRIDRDLEYWNVLQMALSDFWWGHVEPAREIYSNYVVKDPLIELKGLCPEPKHELYSYIVEESKRVVGNSRLLMREINGIRID
ncbi:unnamed protein product [Lactuca saligna]|uniref:YqaJ viral recombinase domain-containing protein n=1 Tax=Lactuca saligna TaxID=75948 RepID=A0AA36EGE8_LACSI|nr:unnamed protein product [Lactuca saligna]